MKKINLVTTLHWFEKTNLVALKDKRGLYDLLVCKKCKMKGKKYDFDSVCISERYKRDVEVCKLAKVNEIQNV